MRNTTMLIAAAAMLTLAAPVSAQPETGSAPEPAAMAKQFHLQKMVSVNVNYLLFLPREYDAKAEKRWPLILFLHGAGERGTNLRKVGSHGPSRYINSHPDFPFILVSPQCPDGEMWSRHVLVGLLDEITAKYAVDTNRTYLTGLSMGGYGTWDLGLAYPERFAAIAPVCGGGELLPVLLRKRDKNSPLKTLGVWAFHGGRDTTVPLAESQRMVDALRNTGVKDVKLTVYPEAGHDSWTKTYQNPELYEWLLWHERR